MASTLADSFFAGLNEETRKRACDAVIEHLKMPEQHDTGKKTTEQQDSGLDTTEERMRCLGLFEVPPHQMQEATESVFRYLQRTLHPDIHLGQAPEYKERLQRATQAFNHVKKHEEDCYKVRSGMKERVSSWLAANHLLFSGCIMDFGVGPVSERRYEMEVFEEEIQLELVKFLDIKREEECTPCRGVGALPQGLSPCKCASGPRPGYVLWEAPTKPDCLPGRKWKGFVRCTGCPKVEGKRTIKDCKDCNGRGTQLKDAQVYVPLGRREKDSPEVVLQGQGDYSRSTRHHNGDIIVVLKNRSAESESPLPPLLRKFTSQEWNSSCWWLLLGRNQNQVEFLPFDELLEFKHALAEYSLSGQAGAEADTIDTWLDEELHGIGDVFAVDKTGKRFVAHRMGKENVDWYKANRARLLAEAEKVRPEPMHGDQDGNQKKKGPEAATIRAYEELARELDPAKFFAKEREVSRKLDYLRRKTKE